MGLLLTILAHYGCCCSTGDYDMDISEAETNYVKAVLRAELRRMGESVQTIAKSTGRSTGESRVRVVRSDGEVTTGGEDPSTGSVGLVGIESTGGSSRPPLLNADMIAIMRKELQRYDTMTQLFVGMRYPGSLDTWPPEDVHYNTTTGLDGIES